MPKPRKSADKPDPKFVVQMVRPDVPDLVKRLAEIMTKEAREAAGVDLRPITAADAASFAIREALERRERGGRKP